MEANKVVFTTPLELQILITDAVNAALKYGQPLVNVSSHHSADAPDLISIKQASKVVNLAISTIYGLVGRHEIPFMKRPHSKNLYFSRKELENWIREGRQKTVAECTGEVNKNLKSRAK